MIETAPTILTMPADLLAKVSRFKFEPVPAQFGRIEIYERPHKDHIYSVGADFALGLEGRDFDAACVLDLSVSPIRQVAEVHVHLGEAFDRLLYPLLTYYNEAFLCGERQFGLAVMRSLLNTYGHAWMYYDRSEESRSRRMTDKLGYWRGTGDVCIPNLRRALAQKEIVIRSKTLLGQLRGLQYAAKSTGMDNSDVQDKHLGIRLKGGGSPDLVMGLGYAWHGARECPKYDRPGLRYAQGTLGHILGHEILDNPVKAQDAKAYFRSRRNRR